TGVCLLNGAIHCSDDWSHFYLTALAAPQNSSLHLCDYLRAIFKVYQFQNSIESNSRHPYSDEVYIDLCFNDEIATLKDMVQTVKVLRKQGKLITLVYGDTEEDEKYATSLADQFGNKIRRKKFSTERKFFLNGTKKIYITNNHERASFAEQNNNRVIQLASA